MFEVLCQDFYVNFQFSRIVLLIVWMAMVVSLATKHKVAVFILYHVSHILFLYALINVAVNGGYVVQAWTGSCGTCGPTGCLSS